MFCNTYAMFCNGNYYNVTICFVTGAGSQSNELQNKNVTKPHPYIPPPVLLIMGGTYSSIHQVKRLIASQHRQGYNGSFVTKIRAVEKDGSVHILTLFSIEQLDIEEIDEDDIVYDDY